VAQVAISRADRFPVGTTVAAYPASNWAPTKRPPSGAPEGSSTASAAVQANGTVTITGLADATDYYLYASVSSEHRYIGVRTPDAAAPVVDTAAEVAFTPAGTIAATNVQAAIEEAVAEAGGGAVDGGVGGGSPGMWALPTPFGQVAGGFAAANTMVCVRFTPVRDFTVASVKYEVETQAAGADVYVAIYSAALARLAMSAEQVDQAATTGLKTATLSSPLAVTAGTDYYAAVVSNASPWLRVLSQSTVNNQIRFGSTAGLVDVFSDASAYPPPSTATIETAGVVSMPLLTLHE
jgi:hypothetical protein